MQWDPCELPFLVTVLPYSPLLITYRGSFSKNPAASTDLSSCAVNCLPAHKKLKVSELKSSVRVFLKVEKSYSAKLAISSLITIANSSSKDIGIPRSDN